MNTKEMNIKELEMVNGGKDNGYFICKPGIPLPKPIGPINAVSVIPGIPLPRPVEIPGPETIDEGPNSVPCPTPLFLGDFVCFTMC